MSRLNDSSLLGGVSLTNCENSFTMNMLDYSESYEWVILSAKGRKNSIKYPCCNGLFLDITFTIYLRRRPQYYFFNLIIPCIIISLLTITVFYLPSDWYIFSEVFINEFQGKSLKIRNQNFLYFQLVSL